MNWIDALAFVAVSLAIGGISFVLGFYGVAMKWRRDHVLLKADLSAAIRHSQPTWEQLVDMAKVDFKTAWNVDHCIRRLHKDVLMGKDQELAPHRALLESYIDQHKRAEPFDGLPTETRVQLERLREPLAGKEHLLEPLTNRIRELVSMYERDKVKQRRYTAWGFFLAVASFVFASYAYFYPYVPK